MAATCYSNYGGGNTYYPSGTTTTASASPTQKKKNIGLFGRYETSDVSPVLLEGEANQWAIQQMMSLLGGGGGCGRKADFMGLGEEGQQLLKGGMGLVNNLLGAYSDPSRLPGFSAGLTEIEKTLAGGYDPRTSPYYEGLRKESDMLTERSADLMRHGQQTRGSLASTPGMRAEGEMRATADAKTLQTLGSLYESERGRMTQATSQALGYAGMPLDTARTAFGGIGTVSPLATYDSDVYNQAQMFNANLASQRYGQQLGALSNMMNYGTYYMPEQYYQPGVIDYALGAINPLAKIFGK